MPGSFYACHYDNDWYFGVVNYISHEHLDVKFKFMHPIGPSKQFFWPNRDDICWVPLQDIVCKVDAPASGSTGRFYKFTEHDIENALKAM